MLELDHVFCLVADPERVVRRLEDDGWFVEAGQAHGGQGRPLVFVLEASDDELARRRPRAVMPGALAHRRPGELREVHVRGPSPPSLPRFAGPPIVSERGSHRMVLVVGDGPARRLADGLLIRG